jgi:hypothetical protein
MNEYITYCHLSVRRVMVVVLTIDYGLGISTESAAQLHAHVERDNLNHRVDKYTKWR